MSERREWIKPIFTEGVPKYAEQPMRWIFESVPRKVYYGISIAPQPGQTEWRFERLTLSQSAEGAQATPDYIAFLFKTGHADLELVQQGYTKAARRWVIELRKEVLRCVKNDHLNLAQSGSPLALQISDIEPLHAACADE